MTTESSIQIKKKETVCLSVSQCSWPIPILRSTSTLENVVWPTADIVINNKASQVLLIVYGFMYSCLQLYLAWQPSFYYYTDDNLSCILKNQVWSSVHTHCIRFLKFFDRSQWIVSIFVTDAYWRAMPWIFYQVQFCYIAKWNWYRYYQHWTPNLRT